jgi:glutamine synthetase
MLRAGLDGIVKQMEAPNPAEENLYLFDARRRGMVTLPTSLNEALDAMDSNELIHEALGANAYDRFVGAKRLEWDDYVRSVSPWELERYLRIY